MKKQKKRYTLFLINPELKYAHYGSQFELCNILNKKKLTIPLALPIIAALTPENYDIKIIDEDIEPIPENITPDLVGITTSHTTIKRAYKISDQYRKMGIPVIMGGAYATFKAEEVLEHADCVVKNEVENKWEELIKDFEKGNLKKIYDNPEFCDLKKRPIPRWDLVDTSKIVSIGIEASRGCPYNCEFCIVTKMFGRRQRFRDIETIIDEIKSSPLKRFFFVDDNLTFNKTFAKKLMKKIKPLNISWVCQSSIDVADDEELLLDMAEAGCLSILIGFESLNPKSLAETRKKHNLISKYENAVNKIHSVGIQIIASFIIGFDADTNDDFDYIYNFTMENNLPFVVLSILTIAPGTDLYNRIKKENRLYNIEPYYYTGVFPCMQYKNISFTDMFDKFYDTVEKIFSIDNVSKKAINLFESGKFNQERSGEVGIVEKILISIKILKMFYFTKNKAKKSLFKQLFQLALEKKLGFDKIVFFLTSMAGFQIYLKNSRTKIGKIKKNIEKSIL